MPVSGASWFEGLRGVMESGDRSGGGRCVQIYLTKLRRLNELAAQDRPRMSDLGVGINQSRVFARGGCGFQEKEQALLYE